MITAAGFRLGPFRPSVTTPVQFGADSKANLRVGRLIVTNTSSDSAEWTLYQLGSSGTPSDSDAVVHERSLAGKTTDFLADDLGIYVPSDDRLFVRVSAVDSIVFTAYFTRAQQVPR